MPSLSGWGVIRLPSHRRRHSCSFCETKSRSKWSQGLVERCQWSLFTACLILSAWCTLLDSHDSFHIIFSPFVLLTSLYTSSLTSQLQSHVRECWFSASWWYLLSLFSLSFLNLSIFVCLFCFFFFDFLDFLGRDSATGEARHVVVSTTAYLRMMMEDRIDVTKSELFTVFCVKQ